MIPAGASHGGMRFLLLASTDYNLFGFGSGIGYGLVWFWLGGTLSSCPIKPDVFSSGIGFGWVVPLHSCPIKPDVFSSGIGFGFGFGWVPVCSGSLGDVQRL